MLPWQKRWRGGEGRREVEMKTQRQQRGVLNHSPAGAAAGGWGGDQEEEQGNTHCHSAAGGVCACKSSQGKVQVSQTNVGIVFAPTIVIPKCFCTRVQRFDPTLVWPREKTVILSALLRLGFSRSFHQTPRPPPPPFPALHEWFMAGPKNINRNMWCVCFAPHLDDAAQKPMKTTPMTEQRLAGFRMQTSVGFC